MFIKGGGGCRAALASHLNPYRRVFGERFWAETAVTEGHNINSTHFICTPFPEQRPTSREAGRWARVICVAWPPGALFRKLVLA